MSKANTRTAPSLIRVYSSGTLEIYLGDPPVYAGVKAGGALPYITHDPDTATLIRERRLEPDIFLWVNHIDPVVYHQHRAGNAELVEELTSRPWGVNRQSG